MRLIKAKFEVVTPMFLGESSAGGEIRCAESIRGASIKGALRAHFRALNWSRLRNAHSSDQDALNALHKEEADVFGAAVKDKKGGQASFLLRVKSEPITPEKNFNGCTAPVQYLLGMGLYHFRNGLLREHIPVGTTFWLELALKPSVSEQQTEQLRNALLAFGLLGGLGSRARKGFGSVSITKLAINGEAQALPKTAGEYSAAVKKLIGDNLIDKLPPFTAFSSFTHLQVSGKEKNAVSLLAKHGQEMGLYRGYGNNHSGAYQVFEQKAEQNFKQDHDWAYDLVSDKADQHFIPQRTVFGLPHPYRLGNGANVRFEPETGRRASPLFAHVHRLPDGTHLLVHTVYRSEFLPHGVRLEALANRNSRTYVRVDEKIDWTVLERFLQRFRPSTEDVIYG